MTRRPFRPVVGSVTDPTLRAALPAATVASKPPVPVLPLAVLLATVLAGAPPALAGAPPTGPQLPGAASDTPTASASAEEVKLKTARAATPALKILPLALELPLGVAGISVNNSAPIAWAAGDYWAYARMRPVGLSLMGGGFASGVLLNVVARTMRLFTGGKWEKDLAIFIAGSALHVTGYALAWVGSSEFLQPNPPAVAGVLVGASIAWGAGMILMMVDTLKIAYELDTQLSKWERADPRRPRFAGLWAAPQRGGAAAGFALNW
jgi:hypothetical protein